MEAHLHEWANLIVRWIHLITGVAWIGASFYFNWLENNLERDGTPKGIAGNLWAIHGGGFYFLQKYELAPDRLPEPLHWFKWEAYFTWLTGFALLGILYYLNARTMMIDPAVAAIAPWQAVAISIGTLAAAWLVYDNLCNALRDRPLLLASVIGILLVLLSWGLANVYSGRAAYLHVGAAIGTCMVANVFRVIIPSQKALVRAMQTGEPRDPELGHNALLRSRHNNYLTLPVLFIMISNHYPTVYADQWNWGILAALMLISAGVRHYFNIRHLPHRKVWILPAATAAIVALAVVTSPAFQARFQVGNDANATVSAGGAGAPAGAALEPVAFSQVQQIISRRCAVCHAADPARPGFTGPPAGVRLDTADAIKAHKAAIDRVSVQTRYMPLGNITGMTEAERHTLRAWIVAGAE